MPSGKYTPISKDERLKIEQLLRKGMSQHGVAREVNRSPKTINHIARKLDIPPVPVSNANAVEAMAHFSAENRKRVIAKLASKIEQAVDVCDSPQGLQSLALALAIVVDKARLEDGLMPGRMGPNGEAAGSSTVHVTFKVEGQQRQIGDGAPPMLTDEIDGEEDLEPIVDSEVVARDGDVPWEQDP